MTINTQNFGTVEINPKDILSFHEGLPGFSHAKNFVVLFQEDEEVEGESPICFLQSTDKEDLSFVLIDVSGLVLGYRAQALLEYARDAASGFDHENLAVYNIVTLRDELMDSTANLKAPIVIDIKSKTGRQVLYQGDDYPVRARLSDIMRGESACQC